MLSPADMLIIGAVALIAFGPDQLPKVARKAGQVMRDVQNTSQGFIREMERAAEDIDGVPPSSTTPSSMYGSFSEPTPAYEPFSSEDFEDASPPEREFEGNAAHPFAAYAARPAVASPDVPPIEIAETTEPASLPLGGESLRPHLPESVHATDSV